MGIRAPRTVPAAIALCERFAVLEGQAAAIEATRNAAIAAANATADAAIAPIAAELDQIRPVLEAWWTQGGKALAQDRKTIELGGCNIGTKLGSPSLHFAFGDDKAAVAALSEARWSKTALVRTSHDVDKPAVRKALSGTRAAALSAMGFSLRQSESFVLSRADQAGTIAG